ncbi:MAG TPA: type II secretion system protein [Pirellulales bacterium]|jgi:prepilin-type N-terminal cleavage/methylation domain-containing protein|nr:type II secretion system protein [Pirellulales bacterium]
MRRREQATQGLGPAAARKPALRKSNSGFSLLEIFCVITLVGILAAIVLSRICGSSLDARKNACYMNKGMIEVEAQIWYRNKGVWPASNLSDIQADTNYFPSSLPVCPVDGTSYTLDATTHQVVGHTH